MNEADEAKVLLADHYLRVCERSGLLICVKPETCRVGLPVERERMRHHLSRYHDVDKEANRKLFLAAKMLSDKYEDSDLKAKYTAGGCDPGVLPRIEGIEVMDGKRCVACERIFVKDETLRTHIARCHPNSKVSRTAVARLPVVRCQSLGKRSPCLAPFLIPSIDSEKVCAEEGLEYDPGAVRRGNGQDVEDRYKSPFVDMARVPERLEVSGLTLDQVHLLLGKTSPWNTESVRTWYAGVKSIIRDHFDEAKNLSRKNGQFRNVLSVIQTSGTEKKNKSFKFLEDDKEEEVERRKGNVPRDVKQRYVDHTALVVRVACLVTKHRRDLKDVHISSKIEALAVKVLNGNQDNELGEVSNSVYELLWAIFSEEKVSGDDGAAKVIFCYVVCACICVHHDREDNPCMSNGTYVGSRLAGILYGASCYLSMYWLKFNEGKGWKDAMTKVMCITDPLSQHGLTYMTDLRSICSYLRKEEKKINGFQPCEEHTMCGSFSGKEFSAEGYGRCVRAMHTEIEDTMLRTLLHGKHLPLDFWEKVWGIVEDTEKDLLGYWALSDERNIEFVRSMSMWATDAADLRGLRVNGWEKWKRIAEDIFLLILTAAHITGGGPSRGTEIGSLTLRNTSYGGRRSVYFPKNEVMLLPFYNKTRNIKRGRMILLTRHLDRETSRLFRAFFVLIHPILVMQDEWLSTEEAQRHPVNNVRDCLTLGVWRPKKVSECIGKKMIEFEIPFNFSEFRQHQRGLAQCKRSETLLNMVAEAAELAAMNSDENQCQMEDTVYKASIEQAGHSTASAAAYYAHTSTAGSISLRNERNKIDLFRKASQEWHEHLGLRNISHPGICDRLKTVQGNDSNTVAVSPVVTRGRLEHRNSRNSPGTVENSQGQGVQVEETCQEENTVPHAPKRDRHTATTPDRTRSAIFPPSITFAGTLIEPTSSNQQRMASAMIEPSLQISTVAPTAAVEQSPVSSTDAAISGRVSRRLSTPELGKRSKAVPEVVMDFSEGINSYNLSEVSAGHPVMLQKDGCPVSSLVSVNKPRMMRQLSSIEKHLASPAAPVRNINTTREDHIRKKLCFTDCRSQEETRKHLEPKSSVRNVDAAPKGMDVSSRATYWDRFRKNAQAKKTFENTYYAGCVKASHKETAVLREVVGDVKKKCDSRIRKQRQRRTPETKHCSQKRREDRTGKSDKSNICVAAETKHNAIRNDSQTSLEQSETLRPSPSQLDVMLDTVTEGGSKSLNDLLDNIAGGPLPAVRKQNVATEVHHSEIVRPFESRILGGPFNSLLALRRVTSKKAMFKSTAQREAMEAVAARLSDLLIVLATGEGKTAVVMGPVTKESGVTVWVCPLRALRWETEKRLTRSGLEVLSVESFTAARTKCAVGVVLLVSPEDVVKPGLREAVEQMSRLNTLTRVVVDEAHLVPMAESYRPCFTLLKSAAKLGTLCPIVMLTATAPPRMVKRITRMCGSFEDAVEIHRGDPSRNNLILSVKYLRNAEEETLTREVVQSVDALKRKHRAGCARCLIVCLTIEDAKAVHRELATIRVVSQENLMLYHSKLKKVAREKTMSSWLVEMQKGIKVIVATEGFSTGTDAPNVRLVIFAGASRNMLDFWQGAGRAGRDGLPAEVLTLFHEGHLKRGRGGKNAHETREADKDAGDFGAWARENQSCRRSGVEMCLVGGSFRESCAQRRIYSKSVELCDVCSSRVLAVNKSGDVHGESGCQNIIGVDRPSQSALQKAWRRRCEEAKFADRERVWLRDACKNLKNVCVEHLLKRYSRDNITASIAGCGREILEEAVRCKAGCDERPARCHRCADVNHRAIDCEVFESIVKDRMTGFSSGNGRCRECRILSVHGVDPHQYREFGNEKCPLKAGLFLMMRAWDKDHIRRDMEKRSGGLIWGGRPAKNRKEFAAWMTNESYEKVAGIAQALRWLSKRLKTNLGLIRRTHS